MYLLRMPVDKSKMVLTFKHPRIKREAQELEGRRYFAGSEPQVLHVGVLPKLPFDVAKSTREGDTVWLWALPMVAVDRKSAGTSHHAQITLFCKECRGNRATIVEGSTGRTSDSRSQASAMIEEAHKIVTQGGKRLPKTGAKRGRKKAAFPSSEIEEGARRIWFSKAIASDNAAITEAKTIWPNVVTDRMIRNLGPSGRPWKRKGGRSTS